MPVLPVSTKRAELLSCADIPLSLAAKFRVVNNIMRLTELQLISFLDICYDKYYRALIEPGKQ